MKEKMRHRDVRKLIKKNEFQEFLINTREYIQSHSENIVIGSIAALIIIIAIPLYINNKSGKELKAAEIVSRASYYMNRPVSDREDAARRGFFTSEEEKYDMATTAYMEAIQGYKGTKAAPLAYLGLANAYYSWGKNKEALGYYESFIEKYEGHELYPDALNGKAYSLYTAGDYEKAASVWEEMIKEGRAGYEYYDVKLRLADARLKSGEKKKAKELYREIIKEKEGSYWANAAGGRLKSAGL